MANETTKAIANVKKDRLRFTKNSTSAILCYIAILFNVFYFAYIYSTDVGNYFYTIQIGASVVYNLLFLLFTFLCSEGVKNYSRGYSIFLLIIGALQIVRIFGIPLDAHTTVLSLSEGNVLVMGTFQFVVLCIFLIISSACCIAGGIVGLIKNITLENYKKETGLS